MFMQKFIKKQVILIIITFVLLAIVILGSSYALFQKTFVDTKTQTISLGDLNIAFSSTVNNTTVDMTTETPNAINMTNVMPKTDAEAVADNSNIYTFAIYNSGQIAYNYKIKLEDNTSATNTLEHQYIRYKINDEVPWLLSNTTNGEIYSYIVNPGETHTFTLKLWLAEPEKYDVPNEALGSEIHLNINITGEAANTRAPKGWKYAKEGTLLYGIKQNEPTLNTNGTIPGQTAATTDEGLKEAKDDYGTSFYYRGAVEDNYVVFANKCWRIVRIVGDGSIKLILHNNDEANCDIDNEWKNFANDFTMFNDSVHTRGIVSQYTYITAISFMYGNKTSSNYLEAQANLHDSSILTTLKDWYDLAGTFTNIQKNMLSDVIWCGDKSLTPDSSFENNSVTFNSFERTETLRKPSLVCPNVEGNPNLSKYTASINTDNGYGNGALNEYKIGLITIDEAVFAGLVKDGTQCNYFLCNKNSSYWTLSPSKHRNGSAYVYSVRSNGSYSNTELFNDFDVAFQSLRPAIALKSNVKYTIDTESEYGPGTKQNPFVIVEE